jgi:hypothetical protein
VLQICFLRDTFDKTLVFAVYDYDRFSSSDQTGEYQLPLNQVDLAGPVQEWKDLAPVDDGSNQYLGDLCISLRYVPSSGKLTGAARIQTHFNLLSFQAVYSEHGISAGLGIHSANINDARTKCIFSF